MTVGTASAVDSVAERLLGAAVATTDVLAVALGDQLGFYRCLAAAGGGLSAAELATASGTATRYAREWCEQQATTGLLDVAEVPGDEPADGDHRRFRLAPGVAEALTDPDSLAYVAPLARQLAAAARQLPAIATVVRTGGGVPWAAYGPDMRESEADLNRPAYLQLLADDWLSALPDVQARLRSEPAPRVADVGCGAGWSAIALARGYPNVRIDAYDVDSASVELARHNVSAAGLADRVRVHEADIAATQPAEPYVLVTAFECLHDLPHPVAALAAIRRLLDPDGAVLIGDMKVADTLTAPGDEIERLMYGFSLLICLPDSLSTPGSAATGTVMLADTLRRYAADAGFDAVEVLPIEHDLWRFYRLHPGGRGER